MTNRKRSEANHRLNNAHMYSKVASNILSYLNSQKEQMISFLEALVMAESPSKQPQAQKEVMNLLTDKLNELDFEVFKIPGKLTGGFLLARPQKRIKKRPLQLLIGHCDTVWALGTIEQMPFKQADGQLKGPGIFDMKAGLTQILFAAQCCKILDLPLTVTPVILINSDEEIGSRESTTAIERLAKIADRAFVLEPPLGLDGKLKTGRKGIGRFTITVKGKAAHAGLDPSKGASAIIELSHQIQQLFAMNDPKKGISVNVGMIEGGVSPNVIAPESKAVLDVRILTMEDAKIIEHKIHDLQAKNPETSLEITGKIGRRPMEKTLRNQKLWLLAKEIGSQINLELEEATAGGGSDGNTTSLFTATLDGLGTTGDGAHALHEFIFTEKLVERTALLTLLMLAQPVKNMS